MSALTEFTGTFHVLDGGTEVTSGVTFTVDSENGCDVSIDASGVYTISSVTEDSASAVFKAVYGNTTLYRGFSVAKARAGQSGASSLTSKLTPATLIVASNWDGFVTSYAGLTSQFKVYEGQTDVTSHFTLSTASGGNPRNLGVTYSSNAIGITSGFDVNEDTAALTVNATGSGPYAGVVLTEILVLAKQKAPKPIDFDQEAPAIPTGLVLTSTSEEQNDKTLLVTLNASWNAVDAEDLLDYVLAVKIGSGIYTELPVTSTTYQTTGLPSNTTISAKVAARDKWGNQSAYSAVVSHTTAKDNVAPAAPTGLSGSAAFKTIFLEWTNPTASDLAYVEVYENSANNSTTASGIALIAASSGGAGSFTRSGLASNTKRYYWLKAVDTSGNKSGFSSGINVTTAYVPTDELTGQVINTQIADDAITTPKLASGSVVTNHMAVNSIDGDRIKVDTLDASKIKAGSVLAGTITVSGTDKNLSDAFDSADWATLEGKPDDNDILNTFTQGNVTVINQPEGGTYAQASASVTGSLKIKLPNSWTSTMLRFFVEVYNYSTDTSFTLEVGGYTYTGGPAWYQNYARMTGSAAAERPVRFGHDGDTCCVYIGDANDTWAYPQVTVSNLRVGYSNYSASAWKSGWAISFDTNGPQNVSGTQFLNPLTGSNWTNVSGTGKPQDNATVGAPSGTNVGNQTADNVASWSANPAPRINANTTLIDPGKIQVSGSTTLANWRMGGDLTKIDGGEISANTVTANKLSIGNRGLMIRDIEFYVEGNTLKWTAGLLFYNRDTDNAGTYGNVPAGSQVGSGSSYYYVYWTLPSNQASNTSTPLQVTTTWTTAIAANSVCLATWRSGTKTVVANYGGTIIDGSKITTGSIEADRLAADTILGQNFYVGGTNVMLSGGYGGPGKGAFVVNSGSIPILKAGWLNSSSIGFELRNSNNQVILNSSTNPAAILNSNVTLSSLGYTGANNATYTTNTNQLIDGAGLGTKATWASVTGTGKPANNATVGATIGTNLNGQFNSGNIGTYMAAATIGTAQIGDAAITNAKIGNLAVKSANIDELTVGGNKISSDAVTGVGTYDTTLYGYHISPSYYTNLSSVKVTMTSGYYDTQTAVIWFSFMCTRDGGDDDNLAIRLLKNGTTVVGDFINLQIHGGNRLYSCTFVDPSVAANSTNTYQIQFYSITDGAPYWYDVTLVGVVLKK